MESSSSSHASNTTEQAHHVPDLHLSSFLKEEHAQSISEHQSYRTPKIFTVAETLKDPTILAHIKPDYGSLAEFIGDVGLSKDLLVQKKKKFQVNEEEQEEKKWRTLLKDKDNSNLNSVYLDEKCTPAERRIAGKLLIQSMFKESFGLSLKAFEQQNTKIQQIKNPQINLSRIDEIFDKKQPTPSLHPSQLQKPQSTLQKQPESTTIQKKHPLSKKWTEESKLMCIQNIKSNYKTLRKVSSDAQCNKFNEIIKKQEDERVRDSIGSGISGLSDKVKDQKGNQKEEVFEISMDEVKMERITILTQTVINLVRDRDFTPLKSVIIHKVRLPDESLLFLLDTLTLFAPFLERIHLSCISIEKISQLAIRIREILKKLPIRQLSLQYMDLSTKEFCIICLGIGVNNTLEQIYLDNNNIDENCYTSLEMICRHCSELRKISLRKNELKSYHLSRQMRQRVIL